MTIQQINITNLYGNAYQWQLNPNVNILVGANGTYKSTILNLIQYVNENTDVNWLRMTYNSPKLEVKLTKNQNISSFFTTNIDRLENENLEFIKKIIPTYNKFYQSSQGEKSLIEILAIKSNLIFLDNPENNLHVGWQRNLIKWIGELNPSGQIIMTSHSPCIMADWEEHITQVEDIKVN